MMVANPEWGKKHECPNCETRFYDMLKPSPVTCPDCGYTFETDILHRLRKGKAVKEVEEEETDSEEENEIVADTVLDSNNMILPEEDEESPVAGKTSYDIDDNASFDDDDDRSIEDDKEDLPEDLLGDDLEEETIKEDTPKE